MKNQQVIYIIILVILMGIIGWFIYDKYKQQGILNKTYPQITTQLDNIQNDPLIKQEIEHIQSNPEFMNYLKIMLKDFSGVLRVLEKNKPLLVQTIRVMHQPGFVQKMRQSITPDMAKEIAMRVMDDPRYIVDVLHQIIQIGKQPMSRI